MVSVEVLARIAGSAPNENMTSTLMGLRKAGVGAGLNRPHRLAHYLAQLAHESGIWKYDREIWKPTAAQLKYEGRSDLGNTQPGDGYKYRGRGPIQITGRTNYRKFARWARSMDANAPDFEADPEAVLTDPWEGLSPIWYWDSGNPTGRSLNTFADANDLLTITRRINGGTNGLADRKAKYTRAALVLLGREPDAVRAFQRDAGLAVDGIAGPRTHRALHERLQSAAVLNFGPSGMGQTSPVAPLMSFIEGFLKLIRGK